MSPYTDADAQHKRQFTNGGEARDAELLLRITAAVAAANAAEQTVSTAQTELRSRSKAVGLLLLEAKKLHPKGKDFEAFLNKVQGLKLSRAYDLLRLAGGRTTDEELRKDARERQAKSRAKKKKPPVKQTPFESGEVIELEAGSFRDVTESAEASAAASAEVRKSEYAATDAVPSMENVGNKEALACFKHACDVWLPQLGTADLAEARSYFNDVVGRCAANNRKAA
jgi:hypothetical protein